jgi:hypothetical protein
MNITRLSAKLHEVFIVEPNDLGHPLLTHWYKRTTKFLKTMPFLYIIPMSFMFTVLMYAVFGFMVVRLTSVLQHGF